MQQTSLAQLATWCNGDLSTGSNPNLMLDLVVLANTLFVAIKGENHDGHDFVSDILQNIANTAALVSDDCGLTQPNIIYVPDTVIALGQIAGKYRDQFATGLYPTDSQNQEIKPQNLLSIVALTGSHGKTTVKEMLRYICASEFGSEHVLATEGNLNNHLGVPLMLLRLEPKHRVAIIEMGMNHAGEIEYLSKMTKPNIALINNIHLAHAGFFTGLEDIARAKGEIFSGLQSGGIACVNTTSNFEPMWLEYLHSRNDISIFQYGSTNTRCYLVDNADKSWTKINYASDEIRLQLKVIGHHNKNNAVSAAAIAYNLGCGVNSVTSGLSQCPGYKRRLEPKIAFNGALIIDDTYNAGPASVKAAIDAIGEFSHPHWVIFADLKELGEFEIDIHKEMAKYMQESGVDVLLTVGELAKITHDIFHGNKMHFVSNQDAVQYCMQNLPANATLLVKGSNSMNLDEVVNALIK